MKLLYKNKEPIFLKNLRKQDPAAQKRFYELHVQKFLSVSRSYVSDLYQAEDCVIKSFCKIFKNIESYREDGNLEAWARKIVVNECLNFIKSRKTVFYIDEIQPSVLQDLEDEVVDCNFKAQDLIDILPDAYKMVFNLYVIENYSHQEISELLKISVSVSKTQLCRAKEKLRKIYFLQQQKIKDAKI